MSSADWQPNHDLERKIRDATEAAVKAAANVFLDAAKADTPIETGRMVGSARVVPFGGNEASVLYDNRSAFAAIVHEDLTARHAHGSAKFLEKAMNSQRPKALEEARKAYRERIGD